MENQEELIGVLNDLIKINNDRIAGYEKALKELKNINSDLIAVFTEMADQSRKYAAELIQDVSRLGGDAASDTTLSGKVYRVWMDLKAAISGKDRESILGSCEYGEDVAQQAYASALVSGVDMSTETRQLITAQKNKLKTSHDLIMNYRHLHEKNS